MWDSSNRSRQSIKIILLRKKEKIDKGKNPLTRKKELFSYEKQGSVRSWEVVRPVH